MKYMLLFATAAMITEIVSFSPFPYQLLLWRQIPLTQLLYPFVIVRSPGKPKPFYLYDIQFGVLTRNVT